MRKWFSIVMLISVLTVSTVSAAGGFLPSAWQFINEEEYEAGITSDSFHGISSAYLRLRPDKKGKDQCSLGQTSGVPKDWLGKRIGMTVYVKAVGVKIGAGVYMKIYTDRGEIISDYSEGRFITGSSGWSGYRIVLDVPYDAVMTDFGVWLHGKGEIRADNFGFGIADTGEKPTGKSGRREYGSPSETEFGSKPDGFLPAPWSHEAEYEAGITKSDSFQGSFSAYLRSGADRKEIGSFGQCMYPPKDWLGKRIRLDAYMKSVGVGDRAGAYMRIYTDRGETLSDFMGNRYLRGDSGWNSYRIILDVPYDTAKIEFGAWLKGRGEVRVESFRFAIASSDETVTGKSRETRLSEPRDLDFEPENQVR